MINKRMLLSSLSKYAPTLPSSVTDSLTKVHSFVSTLLQRYQPTLDSKVVVILTILYALVFTNNTFWQKATSNFSGDMTYLWMFAIALIATHIAGLLLFSAKYIIKPALILFIVTAGVASYFVDKFGLVINTDMIRNAAETTSNEAKYLLTPQYFFHVFLYALVPASLLIWTKITFKPWKEKLKLDSLLALACLAVALPLLALGYTKYASTLRSQFNFIGQLHPAGPIGSAGRYTKYLFKTHNVKVKSVGLDAKKGSLSAHLRKKRLTIIIAGETTRAQSFSLNGYKVETNPKLKERNVISFQNTTSCGTSTGISLPCMFSDFTRSNYSIEKAKATENVLDVLTHAGMTVEWWDNNTGDKDIGKRIKSFNISHDKDPVHCREGACLDSLFLKYLKNYLPTITKDTVLVLHQRGSHGPEYYLRHPKEFEKFKPACHTSEFANCSHEQLINSYDNTILFTDHVLAKTIDMLKAHSDQFSTSMIYMSDHGESLGENGIYLHGLPYMLAPKEQTHIPFLAWFSDEFAKDNMLDLACIKASETTPASHDNLFHSLLGILDVQTTAYQKKLDIFAKCRKKAP